MNYWDKRRRKLDHPITVMLEDGRDGTVSMSPQFGCVTVSSIEEPVPLDDLTEDSLRTLWDSKCHYFEDE